MSAENLWIWSLDARFPSVRSGGQYLVAELLTALKRENWNAGDIFAVHLAVEEALANAVRHGNHCDDNKHVTLTCRLAADRLLVEVADEGPGFDPDCVPDCTAPENLKRPGGRGIKLMRNYMSRVEYVDGGHRVVMEKQRSSTD
jgi:serine/threonine-protein kinase RsbW